MTRCVLYARQSSGDDEQSESVDLQLSRLKALEGYKVEADFNCLLCSGMFRKI